MVEVVKSFLPVQTERVWGTITGAVGVVSSYLFGAWNDALEALIVAMLVTGLRMTEMIQRQLW